MRLETKFISVVVTEMFFFRSMTGTAIFTLRIIANHIDLTSLNYTANYNVINVRDICKTTHNNMNIICHPYVNRHAQTVGMVAFRQL